MCLGVRPHTEEEQVHCILGLIELEKDLEVKEKGKWKLFPAKIMRRTGDDNQVLQN